MIKLYAVPPSHPCMSAVLMLRYKGLEFERVEMIPGLHRIRLRSLGFSKSYTPAMTVGDNRFQGTREISRALDQIDPRKPLFPSDPSDRARVERIEEFGEQVLQMMARRLAITSLRHSPDADWSWAYGSDPRGLPAKFMRHGTRLTLAVMRSDYGATDHVAQADLIALPRVLERINRWIGEGAIGNPEPNAADFQIATSLRLLMATDDIAPIVDSGPAGALARAIAPAYDQQLPPTLPERWLEPLRAASFV